MARQAQGWKLVLNPGCSVHTVRFRWAGKRVHRSTGKSDPNEAAVEAAKIYSDVVSGRTEARSVSSDLAESFSQWLATYEMTHEKGTFANVELYVSAQLLPFFKSFESFTPLGYAEYQRMRIRAITRVTLRKELSALRGFVDWCNTEHGMSLPPVPSLPKAGPRGDALEERTQEGGNNPDARGRAEDPCGDARAVATDGRMGASALHRPVGDRAPPDHGAGTRSRGPLHERRSSALHQRGRRQGRQQASRPVEREGEGST